MHCPLSGLLVLSPGELHHLTQGVNRQRAGAEWELAFCLLAIERNQTYAEYNCSSVVVYAERFLELAPYKSTELLRIARSLEGLPLLSQAYREGTLGSGKLRELVRVVTPENEQAWLTFAVTHNTREVERAVAQTPKAYHESQATVSAAQVTLTVQSAEMASDSSASARVSKSAVWKAGPGVQEGAPAEVHQRPESLERREGCFAPPAAPAPPSLIRLTFVVTPDEYAVFESARRVLEAQEGVRMSRNRVLGAMAKRLVDKMDARGRLRKGLIVHTQVRAGEDPEQAASRAVYETDRGHLPVRDPEVRALVEKEIRRGQVSQRALSADLLESVAAARPKLVPRGTERRIFERAQGSCESCGSRDFLQLDHKIPRCRGGNDEEGNLQVLCRSCHSLKHREDFLNDVKFQMGYETALKRRPRAPTSEEEVPLERVRALR